VTAMVLGARISAVGLDERSGYVAVGDDFDDDGRIMHRTMVKALA
jgi:hypothetical protein